ncbi:DUF222 domain-containing protein [Candidatus Poriferisodalis sp.]|uniref:HNH endonuclease signature motif containing protein n=1 Tax=Candidatus Poriferisodalis sp. TaxID=3101277 RepID=UPI003B5A95E5
MFSHVEQALEHLTAALDEVAAAPSDQLRRTLGLSKQLRSRVELLETTAAAVVARREDHGDGGAGLLREHSGLSRSDAARNARTGAELAAIPDADVGVAEGQISLANAARLAQAARNTSPDAVQDDGELIGLAKALPADEFAQAARRWEAQNRDAADLAAQHRRNRRNRHVRFWNGDDGSVQMRGSFDAETGARIQQRLRRQAEQLRQADRRRQAQPQAPAKPDAHNRNDGDGAGGAAAARTTDQRTTDQRTTDQRMADALDTLLAAGAAPAAPAAAPTAHIAPKAASAEIIVRADLAALAEESRGFAEICGTGPIPPSTLARLACNSDVWVEIFGDKLTPLYETVARRAPTAAQRRALVARDGACIGCGARPGDCEAHHVIPWKCGGKTRVDNLVLVCWSCHVRIHDHNWRVFVRDGRFRLIPPGPADPPNPAPSRKPGHRIPQSTPPAPTPQQPPPATRPHEAQPAA